MGETVDELENYCSDDSKVLLENLKKLNKKLTDNPITEEADFENKDTRLLFKMASAGGIADDPEFLRRKCRLFNICALE